MDEDEELLSGRRTRRRFLMVLATLPVFAVLGAGIWYFLHVRQEARNLAMVEQVTGAAFGCVASARGDAPEVWGLERALEHMSRMERVTRDTQDPTTREERVRFGVLAADAARGCEELGRLMAEAQRESVELYFAVPAPLAQPPDQERPERWFRRTLPETRADVVELTRQIRAMAEAINARRQEYELMPQELPIEGREASELARIVELTEPPHELEAPRPGMGHATEAWPTPGGIVVLRRASIGRVPCETRYINHASCLHEFAQVVSWEGELGEVRALERPRRVLFWAAFSPTPDGTIWAIGAGRSGGVVGRYAPDSLTPELGSIDATIDATANIVAVAGGIAVFAPDGTAFFAGRDDGMRFSRTSNTNEPLVLHTGSQGTLHGIEIPEMGRLSVFGDEEGGWTSRLSIPNQDEDVLLRMIDAHDRVSDIVALRAMRSGRAVAVLQRFHDTPDAVVMTSSFGREWLPAAAE